MAKILKLTCLVIVALFASCKKETADITSTGPATLKVQLIGIGSDSEELSSKTASTQSNSPSPQLIEIPINKNLSAYISLEEENESSVQTKLNSSKKMAAKEISPISAGVKYGILVYDGDNLIPNGHKVYTAGQESNTAGFNLDGGKTYTFIGYSRNTNVIPEVSGMNKLSTASINNESGDLLYFRHIQKVSTGDNNLKVTLRHKFTLITTEIKVGTTYQGVIQTVANGSFTQSRQSASIKLSDSTITYSTTTKSSAITFGTIPSTGVKSIKSTPNLLIAPNSTNEVKYSLPSIKVNDIIGTIPATSLNMQAGKKYNLVVTLDVPCSVPSFTMTNQIPELSQADSLSRSFNRINSSQPLVINLTKVDNNFNIFYNNKPLFEARYETVTIERSRTKLLDLLPFSEWSAWTEVPNTSSWSNWQAHDAEFSNNSSTNIRTMKFTDNTFWGNGSIAEIYNIESSTQNPSPVIRVEIAGNGTVSISGKKSTTSTQLTQIVPVETNVLNFNTFPITSPVYLTSQSTFETKKEILKETQIRTKIRKTVLFRVNQLPKNSNGKDIIRIKQSTRHMLPQAGISTTVLSGEFSPSLKVQCLQ